MQASPAEPCWRRRDLLACVFIAAFLLPNLAALVVPYEDFPYSSSPMFAHYVSDETPRYRFRFIAEPAAPGAEWELQPHEIGYQNVEFWRYFFGAVYAPAGPGSPYGHHRAEDRAAFEARLTDFFDGFSAAAARHAPDARAGFAAIRLEVAHLDADNLDRETREVGRYDLAAGRFVHTWTREP